MLLVRVLVVVAFLLAVGLGTRLYRGRRAALVAEQPRHPLVPASLLEGAERTWVLFTTPWCASCGPVEEKLRASDPGARVVKVDATRQPDLARTFSVRQAPTALLADDRGRVQARLVGAERVSQYFPTVS